MQPHRSTMQGLIIRCVLLLASALAAPVSLAQGDAPDVLVRAVTVEVISKIKPDPEFQAVDPAKVAALIENSIVPLFDLVHMTRLAMGHNWHLATPEQQKVLSAEFKTTLVRSYATALANYRGEVVEVKQPRMAARGTEVMVRSEVKRAGTEPMTLDYQMEKTASGWKIYDVKVAGVSLVTTNRDLFDEKIQQGGVDGLIQFLVDENRGGGSRFNSITNLFWEKTRLLYTIFQNMFRSGRQ